MSDPITPVEDVINSNQPTKDPGFLDEGGGLMQGIKAVGNFFKPAVEVGKNAVESVATGKILDVFDGLDDQNISNYKPVSLTDKDKQRVDEIKNLGGFQSVWDIGSGLMKIGGQKMGVLGEDLNLKTDKKIFDEKLGSLQSGISKLDEKLNNLASSDGYKTLTEFRNKVLAEYLKEKGIQDIQDMNDFSAYMDMKTQDLDAYQIQEIMTKQSSFEKEAAAILKERAASEEMMKKYLSENVEGGEEAYKKYQESQSNLLKDNKFFNMIGNIRSDAEEEWGKKFAEKGIVFANFGASYQENYNSFLDDVSDDKQYYYTILAGDIPDKEKVAAKWKESSDIAQKYKMNGLEAAALMKKDPQYKGMSDVEIKKKAFENSWRNLTEEERAIYRNRETLITGIDQLSNKEGVINKVFSKEIIDKPLALLDAMNYAGTTIQRAFDQVFDIQTDGVPHYIAQDTRNLIYASEGNFEKFKSVILYNPDEILSLMGATKAVSPIKIGTEKFITKVINSSDNILMNIPVKIGFGEGTMKIASAGLRNTGKLIKGVVGQQIEGAAQDPIIDNAMQQAPSNVNDQINRITNLLFDTAIIPAFGGLANGGLGVAKKTNNSIMYEFMVDGESKKVVNDFVESMAARGMKISKTDANQILSSGRSLYYNAVNPKEVENLFKEPGKMYEFLSSNIKQMDDIGINKLLTEKGLGIELSTITGIPKETLSDLNKLYSMKNLPGIAPEKQAVISNRIDKYLTNYENFTTGSSLNSVRVSDEFVKNPEYIQLAGKMRATISEIRTYMAKPGNEKAIEESFDTLHSTFSDIQNKFTNIKESRTVTLVEAGNAKNKLVIDITRLEEMSGKNAIDLAKSGTISIPDGPNRGEWNFLKSKEDKTSKAFYLHVRKYKTEVDKFMKENEKYIDRSSAKGGFDPYKTIQNIISGHGKIEMGFAKNVRTIEDANKILKNFSVIVRNAFEDFYGKGTIRTINDIDSLMKNGTVSTYKSDTNVFDHASVIEYLNNQPGKYNLSFGTFITKSGDISPNMYLSFGSELNSQEFAHKLTGKYQSEKVDFRNFMDTFSNIQKKVVDNGFDADGIFSLERGIAKARAIESVTAPISLFENGKLSKIKVMELIKDAGFENLHDDKEIATAMMDMFGGAIEDQNGFVRAMMQNFLYNYVKNRNLVSELLKKIGKGEVTVKQKIDAISHLILNNDEDLMKAIVGKFTKDTSPEVLKKMEEIMNKLGPSIKQSIGGWKEDLLSRQAIIEDNIANLKSYKKQMSTPSQRETVQAEIDSLIASSKSIDNQLSKADKILSEKTFNTLENIYKQYLMDSAARFSKSLLSEEKIIQKTVAESLDGHRDMKLLMNELSDKERFMFSEFRKKLIGYKNNNDYIKLQELKANYTDIEGSEEYKTLVKFYTDSIFTPGIDSKYYDEAALVKALAESMGVYDHDFILMKEYNPVIKSISSLLNNNATGQIDEINELFFQKFNGGVKKDIVELYSDSSEFKEFIDSLFSTNENIINPKQKVKALLTELFEGMVFKTEKSANVLDDLIESAIKDRSFIDRFKRIARLEKRDNVLSVSFEKEKGGKGYTISSGLKSLEIPLQIKSMMDGDVPMDIRVVEGMKWDDFTKLGIKRNKGESSEDLYKRFIAEFNGNESMTFKDWQLTKAFGKDIGDYIFVGNFGDKDSLFHFYKLPDGIYSGKNIVESKLIAQKFYEYHYAYKMGYHENGTLDGLISYVKGSTSYSDFVKKLSEYSEKEGKLILDIQKIRKREGAAMSTFSTFDKVKLPLKTYILAEYNPREAGIIGEIQDIFFLSKNAKSDIKENFSYESIVDAVKKIGRSDYPSTMDEMIGWLEANFGKDLEDGTSYVSSDVSKLRGKIRGVQSKQFKDHFYGIAGDGKATLGKTLFNEAVIRRNGITEHNIVLIGKSSQKLSGGFKPYDKPQKITIDGEEREIIGEIEGTDTSFFKNASSDSHTYDETITFSDSIKTKLPQEYVDEIEQIQINMIEEAFNRYLGSLSNYKINTSTIDDVRRSMYKISSIIESGVGSTVILKEKLKAFLSEVNRIINKPVDEGQSMFIRRSDRRISPNEIIVSKNSPLYLAAKSSREKVLASQGIFPGDDAFSEMMNRPFYSVGYRYPVPSEYNLGVYKIRLSDEFKEYENMGEDQVVAHPQTTYLKIEGDNDGDHLFFLPTDTRIGNVTAKAILGLPVDAKLHDVIDANLLNKYIITPQVEKSSGENSLSLIESRSVALEAKTSIGKVAATIRTLYFIGNIFKDIEVSRASGKVSKWENDKVLLGSLRSENAETPTFGELFDSYHQGFIGLNDEFKQEAAKTLQLAVDFGASSETSFPKGWAESMIRSIGIQDVDGFFSRVVNSLSTTYNNFDPKNGWDLITMIGGTVDKKDLPKDMTIKVYKNGVLRKSIYENDYLRLTGSKRNIYKWIFDNEIIMKHFLMLENDYDPGIAYKLMGQMTNTKRINPLMDILSQIDTINGPKATGYIRKDVMVGLRKKIREAYPELNTAFSKIDNIYELGKKDKRAMYQAKADYFKLIADLSDEEKMIRGMYALSIGEQDIFNFLGETFKLRYLFAADEKFSQSVAKLYEGTGIETPKLSSYKNPIDYSDALKRSLLEIDEKLKYTDEMAPYIKENLEDQKSEVESLIEKLSTIEPEVKPIDDIMKVEHIPSYDIPEISLDSVAMNPHALLDILSEQESFVSQAKYGLKLTMESLFNKYAPTLLIKFDSIQSYLNSFADRRIDIANKVHVSQFSDNVLFGIFSDRQSIYRQLKAIGLSHKEIENLSRKMQKEFLSFSNGEYKAADIDSIKQGLSALFLSENLPDMTERAEFMKRVTEYADGAIAPVAGAINGIQKYLGYDLHTAYEKLDFSMVMDIFEAAKGDAQIALKLEGINSKEQFLEYIQKNADIMGENIWNGTKNAMANAVFKQPASVLDTILNFLQAFHYQLSYGTAATLIHQGNIIAGFSQLLPNYVELRAHLNNNIKEAGEALVAMNRHNLMKFEDQLIFGTGHGKNINQTQAEKIIGHVTKDAVSGSVGFIGKLSRILTGKDIPKSVAIQAGEVTDSFINNILGFNDYPLEELRKVTAIMSVMDKLNFRTADELSDFFDRNGKQAISAFESRARHEFVNSGGGAVSSSSIGRGTIFENSYEYFNNFLTRFFVKANSYLMGWSFHKAATALEKEWALVTGIKRLIAGDTKGFKAHLNDWIAYNTMLGRQFAYTTGLFLKFQKFEDDNEDRLDLFNFQGQFTNILVAWEILLGRHIEAWNSASEYGDGTGDNIGFTAFSLYKKTLRLFRQPEFIDTMYDKYRSDKLLETNGGEPADILKAFNYAVEQHYKSFMTFNAMQHSNDIFNTLQSESNMGILSVGGATQKEKLFEELMTDKSFSSFKDKGLIMSMIGFLGNIVPNNEMAFSVTSDASKKISALILDDPKLSALLNGGEIGKEYLLEDLLGVNKKMTDQEMNATNNLWKSIVNDKAYFELDDKGRRILFDKETGKRANESIVDDMLERQIDDELKKRGKTFEEVFVKNPNLQRNDLKTMAVLAYKLNISTPRMISYIMNREYNTLRNERKGVKGENGYMEMSDNLQSELKREVMLKYQDKINLDRDSVWSVIEQDVIKNKGELLNQYEKQFDKEFVQYGIYDILKSDYLVHQVMKNGDTSISALQSKYALAYRGMPENETTVGVMLKHLQEIQSLPFMDTKTKLANQAAIILGLGKSYNILKNDKKFQELTTDSQKLVSNWLYKISSDASDYDLKSPGNSFNSSAYSKPYLSTFKPKYQSSAYSDKRPNYSKQFAPMKDYLNGKQQFIDRDPDGYIDKMKKYNSYKTGMDSLPIGFNIQQSRMPSMVEYTKYFIQENFRGFRSKPDQEQYQEQSGPSSRRMKVSKAKKSKGNNKQKITGRKLPLHYSKGVRPNLPFSNYEGG